MNRKMIWPAAIVALVSTWAVPVRADAIRFDPNGPSPGNAVTTDLFDPLPGNSITLSLTPGVDNFGTVLFQANFGVATNGGAEVLANCPSGPNCFTFVAAIDVIVTSSDSNSMVLGLDPAGDLNGFRMYANSIPGDDSSGQCFASADCGGTLILTGAFQNFDSLFSFTALETQLLDQSPGDYVGGVQTRVGFGAFTGGHSGHGLPGGVVPRLGWRHNKIGDHCLGASALQFGKSVELFQQRHVANCDQPGVPAIGAINGVSSSNTMRQTDFAIGFQNPDVIP